MSHTPIVLLIAIAVLLAACAPLSSTSPTRNLDQCHSSLSRPSDVAGLFVEPDDGFAPLIDEIANARCSVDVSVYILSSQEIVDALIGAAGRGIRVRVMLEQFPFGGGGGQDEMHATLEAAGIDVRWSANDVRFSHAKFIVVDRTVAVIMNLNLTHAAFANNREFGAVTTSPDAVSQAQAIFDLDWEYEPITPSDGPLIVSPTNSRVRYLDLISRAHTSIDFYAEVVRDPEILAALGAAEAQGVQVRLIVDESIDADSQDALATLHNGGVEIRLAKTLYIHAKLMVIDGSLAIVGSHNFTSTSLDLNRELSVVMTDKGSVDRALGVFERDWLRAIPGAPT